MVIKIKILAFLLFVSLLTSCDNATDIDQPGSLTSDVAFRNAEDLQDGLNDVYNGYNVDGEEIINAVFADNLKKGHAATVEYKDLYNHVLNSTSPIPIWDPRYLTIDHTNHVLNAYKDMEFDDTPEGQEEQSEADNVAGQLYAMRALSHFDLLKYYAESYTDTTKLGVPKMDEVLDNFDFQPTRASVGEIYNFIDKDLDKAKNLIQDDFNDNRYLTKDAIRAIQARINLFKENWGKAEDLADELLQTYPIASPEEYENVYKDESDVGVIWKRVAVQGDVALAALFYANSVNFDGHVIFDMSNDLFNALDENDIRYNVLLKDPNDPQGSEILGKNDPGNNLLINKFPGSSEGPLLNDAKVLTSGEMLLIKAEAEARQDKVDKASKSINKLLEHRYTDDDYETRNYDDKSGALKDILKQRRLELAYEGHRYLDIKRFSDALNIGIQRNAVDCQSYDADECNIAKDDYRLNALPIPQSELNANDEIQQNEGY